MEGIREVMVEAEKNLATAEIAGRYMSLLQAKMRGFLSQEELEVVCDEVACVYLDEGQYRTNQPVPPWVAGGSAALKSSHEYGRDNNEADGVQMDRLEDYKKKGGEQEILDEKLAEWREFILDGSVLPGVAEVLRLIEAPVEDEDDVPF